MLATIKCSYQLLPSLDPQRQQLHRLMSHFPQCSPIQSVKRAGNHAVRGLSERLAQAGFDVRPLMSPTVQRGHEAIRICLHAYNTPEQLHRLLACLASS
jgi:8-amino-7-oxononanoate synthase